MIEEPKKKSKKSPTVQHLCLRLCKALQLKKKRRSLKKWLKSTLNANPESSTLQSTTNPEASNPDNIQNSANPDGDSTANPDGITPNGINPDEDSTANPDGTSPDGHEDADHDPSKY